MGIQISFSAAERYILSSMSYYLHYLLRLRPVEQPSALIFGTAVDAGINSMLLDKSLNYEVNIIQAKHQFELTFIGNGELDYRKKGQVKFSKADMDISLLEGIVVSEEHDAAWYSLREKGYIMLEAYARQIIPRIKEIHAIQYNINLENKLGDSFVGVVDLICTFENDKRILFDNKTASKKYEDSATDESPQLSTYYEALKDEFKLDEIGFIVLPKNIRKKKEPKCEIQVLTGKVNEELIDVTFKKYDEVLDGIKNARFSCSGKCNEQYWGKCCYENYCKSGGRDTTGLVFKK